MSEIRLTGKGAPTRMTKGVVGQHYEDTNTGNIYECLVASEQSKLNGAIGGGYVWKLKYTGDDRNDHEAIFGVGGSGGGGVSSWNDLTDKPFYKTTEKIEVGSQTVTFADMDGMYIGVMPASVNTLPDVGGIVSVNWGGQKFNCPVLDSMNGMALAGNGALAGMGDDNGIPFAMMMALEHGIQFMTAESGTSRAISVEYEAVIYHTLDNRYLNTDQLKRETPTYAYAKWDIGATTEEEVKSFLRANMKYKALCITVMPLGGQPPMLGRFIVPHADYEANSTANYQEFSNVIQHLGNGGLIHPELLVRLVFNFENGVLSSYSTQPKDSYFIMGEDYHYYEIKVNVSGQVVATKVDS